MPMQRRHRSTVACDECRQRKVRCTVTVTGVPCFRCAQDNTPCAVQRGSHALPPSSLSVAPVPRAEPAGTLPGSTEYDSDPERQRDIDEEQSGAEIPFTVSGQASPNSGVPFYTGEHPGVTAVMDACASTQEPVPRHILVRSLPSVTISPGDRDFLQRKGVFTLPQESSRRELLCAYFHHVHPVLPIVSTSTLPLLDNPQDIVPANLLLFWSMALMAVNFVPTSVWRSEGFASRKEMKDSMYSRAKTLYDNGGEADKIVQLQAALLLSFWHSDRDHSQPWYWSGIAISLCQILGLHRNPDSAKFNPLFPLRRRHLWRRLWGVCLFRDRWLSLTLGRPMRIRLSDCDMPLPTPEDVLSELSELPPSLIASYIPQDLSRLAQYWSVLIQLSTLLGDVLTLCYQQLGTTPTLQEFEKLESRLLQFQIPDLDSPNESQLANFYHHHLHLHYRATLITFYRPFVSMTPQNLLMEEAPHWQNRIRSRMENAAAYTNQILDNIARHELVGYAGPMTPPLLVPAMHVHLLNCKSANPLTRKLGFNKLDMCMTVMRELQKTYTSASIFCGIFTAAIQQLSNDSSNLPAPSVSAGMEFSSAATHENNMELPGPTISISPFVSDDVLESLLNESSMYNFWESMNMPDQFLTGYGGM